MINLIMAYLQGTIYPFNIFLYKKNNEEQPSHQTTRTYLIKSNYFKKTRKGRNYTKTYYLQHTKKNIYLQNQIKLFTPNRLLIYYTMNYLHN